jgi:GT2 family glycosyltransferase
MKVAVIIVNYNGKKYLPALLGSIFNYKSNIEQEVFVVDNNSIDDSVDWLKKNYPQIKVLKQLINYGFAEGNNLGLTAAIKAHYDYAMLLNQDTIVSNGYLEKLMAKMESDETIAAVQPAIYLYPDKGKINTLGNVINYLGFGYTYGHRTVKTQLRFKHPEVNYCSGAACLIRIAVLKKIGLFDRDFFMYHEDLDLGWRFKLAGYKNIIEPEAVVYHQYEFSRSIKKFYYMERNRFITIFKNYKIATLILILPALIIMELGLLFFSFLNGWWLEKLKVYLFLISPFNWLTFIKKHREVQRVRTVKDREVIKDFSGVIEHQEVDNILIKIINPFFNWYWQIVKRLIFW